MPDNFTLFSFAPFAAKVISAHFAALSAFKVNEKKWHNTFTDFLQVLQADNLFFKYIQKNSIYSKKKHLG